MIDLFLKGSPELRIAEYLFNKGFTEKQVSHFLFDNQKIGEVILRCNNLQTYQNIYSYFCRLKENRSDWSRECGKQLQKAVDEFEKQEIASRKVTNGKRRSK